MNISFRSSSQRKFYATCALVFGVSAAATIYWCASMPDGMDMPGGWTMSMVWMRMPGQSRLEAAGLFLTMWFVMMVAMMLPSIAPLLWMYHDSHRSTKLTWMAAASYFLVWELFGFLAYAIGMTLVSAESAWPQISRFVPVATALALMIAGVFQLSSRKMRHLARCCDTGPCAAGTASSPTTAWQFGVRLGVQCALCCASFMTILLVVGVMDVRAMAILAAAIAMERLWPQPHRIATVSGILMISAALLALVAIVRS